VLQIALSISSPQRSFFYAGVSGLGSVLGDVIGWLIAWAFWFLPGEFFQQYVPGCTRAIVGDWACC